MTAHKNQDDNYAISNRWFQVLVLLPGCISRGLLLPSPARSGSSISPSCYTRSRLKISLGNTANELKFFPDRMQLIAGKKYKLLLSNPSPQKHYFTAREFASSSWTQKVDAGNVEIKGAIQELELRPKYQCGMGVSADEIGKLSVTVYDSRTYRSRHDWHDLRSDKMTFIYPISLQQYSTVLLAHVSDGILWKSYMQKHEEP